jgi:hypothetical protein
MSTYPVIDRFLEAITGSAFRTVGDLYAPEAHLDATVPGWRYTGDGPEEIAAIFSQWFDEPGCFEELRRQTLTSGEVIEYTFAWDERGVPHAAHHVHVITVDPVSDRIVEDRAFCGGRWDAGLLARMTTAAQVRAAARAI